MAASVIDHLVSLGWDCYSEVTLPTGQDRIDIVAVRETRHEREVRVVECKAELSFDLLLQADRSRVYAHFIDVAVPKLVRRAPSRAEAIRVAASFYGFGVFEVDRDVETRAAPSPMFPKCAEMLLSVLSPEHKTHAKAGSPGGGQWTTFKGTCANLATYVKDHEGCTLAEAVDATRHHYRSRKSALSSLDHWIRKGEVPGVFHGWKGRLWSTSDAFARGVKEATS